jgi:hypothetical protein
MYAHIDTRATSPYRRNSNSIARAIGPTTYARNEGEIPSGRAAASVSAASPPSMPSNSTGVVPGAFRFTERGSTPPEAP